MEFSRRTGISPIQASEVLGYTARKCVVGSQNSHPAPNSRPCLVIGNFVGLIRAQSTIASDPVQSGSVQKDRVKWAMEWE